MRALQVVAALTLISLVALGSVGCEGADEPSADEVIIAFAEAVQARDAASLYCLSAGAVGAESLGGDALSRRNGFERWFFEELLQYESGRDEGEVRLSGQGVQLVKLFALGRGTFYLPTERRSLSESELQILTNLQFGYSQIDLSRLSPGTTFYVATSPPGRVLPIQVPHGAEEISVEALESIMLEWSLIRGQAQDDCAAGWRVASVEPLAQSVRTTPIRWIF